MQKINEFKPSVGHLSKKSLQTFNLNSLPKTWHMVDPIKLKQLSSIGYTQATVCTLYLSYETTLKSASECLAIKICVNHVLTIFNQNLIKSKFKLANSKWTVTK